MTELDRNNLSALATFDYVYGRLYEQGCASINEGDMCLYRGPNGTRCAAGWLIPDDRYTDTLEGILINASAVWNTTNLPDKYLPLVRALQQLHDGVLRKDFTLWCYSMRAMRELVRAYVDN